MWGSSKGRQSERPNDGDDEDHGSGGSIIDEEELTFDDPRSDSDRSRGHHKRLILRCTCRTQRWRPSEPVGWEVCPALISVNV